MTNATINSCLRYNTATSQWAARLPNYMTYSLEGDLFDYSPTDSRNIFNLSTATPFKKSTALTTQNPSEIDHVYCSNAGVFTLPAGGMYKVDCNIHMLAYGITNQSTNIWTLAISIVNGSVLQRHLAQRSDNTNISMSITTFIPGGTVFSVLLDSNGEVSFGSTGVQYEYDAIYTINIVEI
jgi:hypothetical protein